jgi:hypothetical protein
MNKSTKFLLASVSPVALAAGWAMLDSTPANAVVTVNATAHTYASENFVGASAASTILVNSTAVRVVNTSTTTDFATGFMTFTLSNSATFVAAPTATTVNMTVGAGTLITGSTAVVYQVTAVANTTAAAITLGNFSIAGVGTRLATSNQNITITYAASTGNTPTTPSATLAVGSQAYSFLAGSSAVTVDLANSGAGLVFRSSTGASNVTFASLGTLSQAAALTGANDVSGSAQFTITGTDALRAIITGASLSGFSSIYATTAACAATAPTGSVAATITGSSATISPLVIGSLYNICAIANGTSIVPAGTITGVSQVNFASRTVGATSYTPGAYAQSASTLATLSYNGTAATAFYVVGLGSYISAIRVTNSSATAGSIFVEVTPDTTGTAVRGLLDSTLAAGQSKFYLASDIRTAVGTTVLADSNTRATVVFLTSFTGARVQNFIVNPGGVLSGGVAAGSGNTTGN